MSPLMFVALAAAVDFNQAKPVLDQYRCLVCHDKAFYTRNKDKVVDSLRAPEGTKQFMPPGGPRVTPAHQTVIENWVKDGMNWPDAPKAMADDLALTSKLREKILKTSTEKTAAAMKPYKNTIPGTEVSYEMVPIPGGKYTMGSPATEKGHQADEAPQHEVAIEPFWMGKYEVTWNEYRLFMFAALSGEKLGDDAVLDAVSRPTKPYVEMSFGMGTEGYPAISMTQHAANKFVQWLSAKTGHFYRLPTEAEWEYACRAGTRTAYSFGDDASQIGEYAVFDGNANGKYGLVGKKKPNPWGLFDMHGNVQEWTVDQYDPKAYANPQPWVKSTKPYPHAVRGGSWMDPADRLRCAARVGSDPSWKMQDPNLPKSIWYHTDALGLGIRLVRPLKVPSATEMHAYWNNGVAEDQ